MQHGFLLSSLLSSKIKWLRGFPDGSATKNPAASAGDTGPASVQEGPTCRGAAKPELHRTEPELWGPGAATPEPTSRGCGARVPQAEAAAVRPALCPWQAARSPQLEESPWGRRDPARPKDKKQSRLHLLPLTWSQLVLRGSHGQSPQCLCSHAEALPTPPPERSAERPSSGKLPRASLALTDPPEPSLSPPGVSCRGLAGPWRTCVCADLSFAWHGPGKHR